MPEQTPLPDLTVNEACKELNVSHMHIYRLLNAGTLQAYKVGKVTRVHRESLDALKNNNPWKPLSQRGGKDTPNFWPSKPARA